MDSKEILARIELIIDHPTTREEDKLALKQGCDIIKKAITQQEIIKAIEFLAAILGMAASILALST